MKSPFDTLRDVDPSPKSGSLGGATRAVICRVNGPYLLSVVTDNHYPVARGRDAFCRIADRLAEMKAEPPRDRWISYHIHAVAWYVQDQPLCQVDWLYGPEKFALVALIRLPAFRVIVRVTHQDVSHPAVGVLADALAT